MTGTGTQENPYIVMNYNDLCNMTGGENSYYKLGADIDFSQTDRKADDEAIIVCFKEFDGNNHILKNYFRRENNTDTISSMFLNSGTNFLTFKNLKIIGAYFTGGAITLINQNHNKINKFVNCQISIKFLNTQNIVKLPQPLIGKAYIEDSEVLIEGSSNYTKPILAPDSGNGFYGCIVKTDITLYTPLPDYEIYIFGHTVSFSGFTGKISCKNKSHINIILSYMMFCSYFAMSIDTINDIQITQFEGINFYDKDIINSELMPSNSKFLALTTEQCKDGNYLNSIGFPCNSGELI